MRPADMQFLRDLRAVCDEYGIILGMDEVQSGMGRTGKLFAYEWSGIAPDVMSSAKGIGGGFPLGAVLAKEQFAKALMPGTHGTTLAATRWPARPATPCLISSSHPAFWRTWIARAAAARRTGQDRAGISVGLRGCPGHGPVAGPEMRPAAGQGAGGLHRGGPDGHHRRRERPAACAAACGDRRDIDEGMAMLRRAARVAVERGKEAAK